MARFSASARLSAGDELRHHHIFERVEFRQQMMELIDEADVAAPDAGAFGIAQRGAVAPVQQHRTAIGAVEQPGDLEQRRFAGARRGDQRHRLALVKLRRRTVEHMDFAVALLEAALQVDKLDDRCSRALVHGLTRTAGLRRDRDAPRARMDKASRGSKATAP